MNKTTKKILDDGTIVYENKNGRIHSENDQPAMIFPDGAKMWYKNGEIHRDNDLPAVILSDGTQEWYKVGLLHRENDLPAIEYADGTKAWCKNGRFHRDNKPAVIYYDGTEIWYNDGSITKSNEKQINKNYEKIDGITDDIEDFQYQIKDVIKRNYFKNSLKIPLFLGRPNREEEINKNDIINLKIALETVNSLIDFFNLV